MQVHNNRHRLAAAFFLPFSAGKDEPYEVEDRSETEGGSEHLRHVDDLQRDRHEVSRSPFGKVDSISIH